MDTRNVSVWSIRDVNKTNKTVTGSRPETEDATCYEERLLNSPFESFSPSSRRGASSNGRRQSSGRGENDGGQTPPSVVYHHHHRETAKMPTTASHPKSTTAFRQLSDLLWQAQLNSVARRNERERKRVKLVNNGFAALRQKIPSSSKLKADFSSKSSKASKLSKVETLRSAIKYINHLQYLLKECNPNNESAMTTTVDPIYATSSETYSDSESLNYNTDCSVFSDNTNNRNSGHNEDVVSSTRHSADSYTLSNDKESYSTYEPINYTPCYQTVRENDSYIPNFAQNNYNCYTPVSQNEFFGSW